MITKIDGRLYLESKTSKAIPNTTRRKDSGQEKHQIIKRKSQRANRTETIRSK